ncbi:MAG: spiro-SPASM protein [Spirochaetaceae bacterium]|jgi:spiro-SPASM protein|nr:spiro-SPASM protein [Spirochaetaceae bacterium]
MDVPVKEMNALAVLYGGALHEYAFQPLAGGKNAFICALQRAGAFRGLTKIVLLVRDDFDEKLLPSFVDRIALVRSESWNTKKLLDTIVREGEAFDLIYFAWADCPLLDVELAGALEARHRRYAAEYTYQDGLPGGLAPELLVPATAVFLQKLNAGAENPVERDALFSVLQKDINSFDIETELSSVDLRSHRLNLAADSKRNLLLIERCFALPWAGYQSAQALVLQRPELLRTLPAFFPIMVTNSCPQKCAHCPHGPEGGGGAKNFMPLERFKIIVGKIAAWTDDAVIDLSLWGELAMHPQKIELIKAVLEYESLSLVIETCGVGWSEDDVKALSQLDTSALSWIVSLDTNDPAEYARIHGKGFVEAVNFVHTLQHLVQEPRSEEGGGGIKKTKVYVQALRCKGKEDDIEKFYRYWKEQDVHVIVQKYDYFCTALPDLRAGDISPVLRQPCWHIMRDMPILIDGTVVSCREAIVQTDAAEREAWTLGNIFNETPDSIWTKGAWRYKKQCEGEYGSFCDKCDEYYTYNF